MKIIILAQTLLRKNSWFAGVFQTLLVLGSLLLAWLLRFDFALPDRRLLLAAALLLIPIRLAAIAGFGLLHGWWRYTGLNDAADVAKAIAAGSVVFVSVMRYSFHLVGFPRSVYVLEPLLTAATLIAVRAFSRVLAESVRQDLASSRKVLLIGAGIGAQTIARELKRAGSQYALLGYVDDDASKQGLKIEGFPVIGTVDRLPEVVRERPVDEVLIAVPSASSKQMQRFVSICEQAEVKFRTVPSLLDVITHNVKISDFREVDLEDLLGREPVEIDLESVRSAIQGKSVLVTGAAGSIGSELCRQILRFQPRTLVCLDHNENGMFYLERELSLCCGLSLLRFQVADIRDQKRTKTIFRDDRPETIFHAAAYKHVPMMEVNVAEAVQNNVFGLLNLLNAAQDSESKTFILISSDKAVNPSCVMGATKRICELILSHQPTNGLRCLSVRFGNVLGSNGSVIPLFQKQLQRGEPLTVTHPEMKRFFMTIREAVSLVLQASVIGHKGDTLVLEMGRQVPILELAQTLIRLSGKSEKQVPIQFIGLRPGEKLKEELFYADEEIYPTSFPTIQRARGVPRDWNLLQEQLDSLEASLFLNGSQSIRAKIHAIVPEYIYFGTPAASNWGRENEWPRAAAANS